MDTNKLHRHLNLPFRVDKPEVLSQIDVESIIKIKLKTYGFVLPLDCVPTQLKEWIESKGLHVGFVESFFLSPQQEMGSVHIDSPSRVYGGIPRMTNHIKLNFYFDCPKDSYMCWYEHLDPENPEKWFMHHDNELYLEIYRENLKYFKFLDNEEKTDQYFLDILKLAEDHMDENHVEVKRNNVKKVYEVECTQPSIVNVGQIHNARNPTDNYRWTFCVVPVWDLNHQGERVDNLVHWDDAMQIFKDEII